ncbi:MAG TPA: hypothetical protein VHJ18_22620 [Streptosporangiaceae bacterium]|nr:hypothetical protein [Streptosporangiaceae bacterium]
MPSSTAARSGAAARTGQVPKPRGQQARKPERGERSVQPGASAESGGKTTPSTPGLHLPGGTAGNVLWWGGLAAVAALGIVDWPVAALVGAGSWVAEQHVRRSEREHAR